MNLDKYKMPGLSEKVLSWVNINLRNYLKKNSENQTEVEHIIDFLMSNKAPKRIKYMSYDEAKKGAEKWTKTLIKKAANIIETEKDTKTVIDFKNGMRLVKLKGESAFKREGHLMKHCVSSYFGKEDTTIYSLRDINNNPHCTIEVLSNGGEINQIKGKGNGSIHPKYISYVIKSLKKIGKEINAYELKYLGYSELDENTWKFINSNFKEKSIGKLTFNNSVYFYNQSILKEKL